MVALITSSIHLGFLLARDAETQKHTEQFADTKNDDYYVDCTELFENNDVDEPADAVKSVENKERNSDYTETVVNTREESKTLNKTSSAKYAKVSKMGQNNDSVITA